MTIGNTAIRIGEQLESIDKQRSRAAEARELILYFLDLCDGKAERLDELRETSLYKVSGSDLGLRNINC